MQDAVCAPVEPLWLNGNYVDYEPIHSFYICKELLMMDVFGRFWCTCNDEKALEVLGDKSKLYMIR